MNFITNGTEDVVMGSGDLYGMPTKGIVDLFTLTTTEEEKLVYLGFIEANAILKAAVEKSKIKAANGGDIGSIVKSKTVTFKTGIMSWNLDNIAKLLTGSDYETEEITGKTTFTYAHEDQSPNVYLRFVSTDDTAKKKITINMFSCSSNSELSFDFNLDRPVTFDYSFDVTAQTNTESKHVYYQIITETIV
jgi:hypothetical protein